MPRSTAQTRRHAWAGEWTAQNPRARTAMASAGRRRRAWRPAHGTRWRGSRSAASLRHAVRHPRRPHPCRRRRQTAARSARRRRAARQPRVLLPWRSRGRPAPPRRALPANPSARLDSRAGALILGQPINGPDLPQRYRTMRGCFRSRGSTMLRACPGQRRSSSRTLDPGCGSWLPAGLDQRRSSQSAVAR